MSSSECKDTGRMKGLIGFWNSKSVSETESFRPSAVSPPVKYKSVKKTEENLGNNFLKSSINQEKCDVKDVSSNYLADRVNKIEDERREMEKKIGERGNCLDGKLGESFQDTEKPIGGGLNQEKQPQKPTTFTRKQQQPSSIKSSTAKSNKTISPFTKFKQMETNKSIITQPENRRSTEKTKAFSKGSVRFPSPCSEPSSPSSESKIKRNLAARSESTAKEIVLNWVKERIKNYPIVMTNFSSCWSDGLAFCALVHSSHPEALDWNSLEPENRKHNFTEAFQKAEEFCDIYPLLDVEDMVRMAKPDWKCVFTYVQSFYRRFRSCQPKNASSSLSPSSNVPSAVTSTPPPASSSSNESSSEIPKISSGKSELGNKSNLSDSKKASASESRCQLISEISDISTSVSEEINHSSTETKIEFLSETKNKKLSDPVFQSISNDKIHSISEKSDLSKEEDINMSFLDSEEEPISKTPFDSKSTNTSETRTAFANKPDHVDIQTDSQNLTIELTISSSQS